MLAVWLLLPLLARLRLTTALPTQTPPLSQIAPPAAALLKAATLKAALLKAAAPLHAKALTAPLKAAAPLPSAKLPKHFAFKRNNSADGTSCRRPFCYLASVS